MFDNGGEDRKRLRAEKLRREASNCLSVAIAERSDDHAAELIDEAVKLAQRARQITLKAMQNAD